MKKITSITIALTISSHLFISSCASYTALIKGDSIDTEKEYRDKKVVDKSLISQINKININKKNMEVSLKNGSIQKSLEITRSIRHKNFNITDYVIALLVDVGVSVVYQMGDKTGTPDYKAGFTIGGGIFLVDSLISALPYITSSSSEELSRKEIETPINFSKNEDMKNSEIKIEFDNKYSKKEKSDNNGILLISLLDLPINFFTLENQSLKLTSNNLTSKLFNYGFSENVKQDFNQIKEQILIFNEAKGLVEKENYSEAINKASTINMESVLNEALKSEINNKLSEWYKAEYMLALKNSKNNKYEKAISIFLKIITNSPYYKDSQIKIVELKNIIFKNEYDYILKLEKSGKIEDAIIFAKKVSKESSFYKEIQNKLNTWNFLTTNKNYYLNSLNYQKKGDYYSAISEIKRVSNKSEYYKQVQTFINQWNIAIINQEKEQKEKNKKLVDKDGNPRFFGVYAKYDDETLVEIESIKSRYLKLRTKEALMTPNINKSTFFTDKENVPKIHLNQKKLDSFIIYFDKYQDPGDVVLLPVFKSSETKYQFGVYNAVNYADIYPNNYTAIIDLSCDLNSKKTKIKEGMYLYLFENSNCLENIKEKEKIKFWILLDKGTSYHTGSYHNGIRWITPEEIETFSLRAFYLK